MDGSTAPTTPNATVSLDDRDVSILSALQQDGQLTVSDLSDRVGLSPSACHRRVKALERAGIIDRYVAVLNPRAMGRKTFPIWLDVNLSSQNAKAQAEFEAELEKIDEVRLCYFVGGTTDYLLKIEVEDSEAYDGLHREKLSVLPHVERIVSKVQIREIFKREGVPLDSEA